MNDNSPIKTKILWSVSGFCAFVGSLVALFFAAFYVDPSQYKWILGIGGTVGLAARYGLMGLIPKERWDQWILYIGSCQRLYFFMRGMGLAFLSFILGFMGLLIYGAMYG